MIKINKAEAVKVVFPAGADPEDDAAVLKALSELRRRTGRPVFITAGRRGSGSAIRNRSSCAPSAFPNRPTSPGRGQRHGRRRPGALRRRDPRGGRLDGQPGRVLTVQQLATTGTAKPEELGPRLEMWLDQG